MRRKRQEITAICEANGYDSEELQLVFAQASYRYLLRVNVWTSSRLPTEAQCPSGTVCVTERWVKLSGLLRDFCGWKYKMSTNKPLKEGPDFMMHRNFGNWKYSAGNAFIGCLQVIFLHVNRCHKLKIPKFCVVYGCLNRSNRESLLSFMYWN